jgi:phosphate transport system protein
MELKRMSDPVLGLLERAVNLLDTLDAELADAVFARHENLEPEFEHCLRRLSTLIWEDTRVIGSAIGAILVLNSLQRIGDRCKNVAEYVVYAVTGVYRDVDMPGGLETARRGRP